MDATAREVFDRQAGLEKAAAVAGHPDADQSRQGCDRSDRQPAHHALYLFNECHCWPPINPVCRPGMTDVTQPGPRRSELCNFAILRFTRAKPYLWQGVRSTRSACRLLGASRIGPAHRAVAGSTTRVEESSAARLAHSVLIVVEQAGQQLRPRRVDTG